jgi:hypothetical protein
MDELELSVIVYSYTQMMASWQFLPMYICPPCYSSRASHGLVLLRKKSNAFMYMSADYTAPFQANAI